MQGMLGDDEEGDTDGEGAIASSPAIDRRRKNKNDSNLDRSVTFVVWQFT